MVTPGVKEEGKPKSVKEHEDLIQGHPYQDKAKVKLEDELSFIQESDVAEARERQGWRRTSVGSLVQEFKHAKRMPMPQCVAF